MFSLDLESRILQKAQEKGLLKGASPAELAPAKLLDPFTMQASSMWGPRLDELMRSGRISQNDVAALAFDLLQSDPESENSWTTHPLEDLPDLSLPTFGSRYETLTLLGEGATSHVYRAFDSVLQRWVALKFLKALPGSRANEVLVEARAQAQIEHPNVCRIYEVGETDDRGFIAMQLVEGDSLAKSFRALDEPTKVRMVRDIAEGVHAAHRKGLVHLDLKPGNILVQRLEDGELHPLLSDFGMMRSESSSTVGLCPMGTPPYSSPEQIAGDFSKVDRRSDVYSLGVLLYVLLTQSFPFEAETFSELLEAIQHRRPIPLHKRMGKVAEDLEAILGRCLEKDPLKRYDSAQAFADDLQRYLEGEPVQAKTHSLAYRLKRWMGRNRKLAAALLVGFLGIAMTGSVLGYMAWFAKRQGEWAQKFEQDVDQWDTFLHRIYALPAHNIQAELAQVKEGLKSMELEVAHGGRTAQGPGHYALGRMNRLLGNTLEGWRHTDQAWKLGYRTDQCMTIRAQMLLEQYQMNKASIRGNAAFRAEQSAKLRRTLLDPALQLLSKANSTQQNKLLQIAHIHVAIAQDELEKAVDLAESYRKSRDWDFESWLLESDLRTQLAWHLADKGGLVGIFTKMYGGQVGDRSKIPEILNELNRASEINRHVLQISPSNPDAYASAAEISRHRTMLEITEGIDIERVNAETEQWIQDGLRVDPASRSVLGVEFVHLRASVLPFLWEQGRDTRPVLKQIGDILRAHPDAFEVGFDYGLWFYDWNNAGWALGEPELRTSHEMMDWLESAYQRLPSQSEFGAAGYEASLSAQMAIAAAHEHWECGIDPTPAINTAMRWTEKGPHFLVPQRNSNIRSSAWLLLAEFQASTNQNAQDSLNKARQAFSIYQTEEEINREALAWSELKIARIQLQNTHSLGDRDKLLQALKVLPPSNPQTPGPPKNVYRRAQERGKAHLLLAQMALERGETAEPPLREARESLELALASLPESTEIPERLAEWALLKAKILKDPRTCLEEGLAMAERSLHYPQPLTEKEFKKGKKQRLLPQGVEWPHQPRSLRFKGELLWELAKLEKDPKQRNQKIREAEVVLKEALARNRFLGTAIQPLLGKIESSLAPLH
jgi:hypothetical protein